MTTSDQVRQWQKNHPERVKATQRRRYLKYLAERKCIQCKQPNDSNTATMCNACRAKRKEWVKGWRQRHLEREVARTKTGRQARREAILEHYGRSCTLCGSTESLQLDHVNNDGRDHRRQIGGASDRTYRWVIKNGFPTTFQILCGPCNLNKSKSQRALSTLSAGPRRV